MNKTYEWEFPLPRTHTGMLLGNGRMGLMVWGEGRVLNVTIGRADFWDRRDGFAFTPEQNYRAIRECLSTRDAPRINAMFATPPVPEGRPGYPTVLPVGRIELHLPAGARLTDGTLDLARGTATVRFRLRRRVHELTLTMEMTRCVAAASLPAGVPVQVKAAPAWEYVADHLSKISFEPPRPFRAGRVAGWTQMRPADPTLAVAWQQTPRSFALATGYGEDDAAAREVAAGLLADSTPATVRRRAREWFAGYWRRAPELDLPNPTLQFVHDYGMFKFAGLTNPAGVPATLQGPWIEEHQMVPWSSDYHFNVNAQMCIWPGYHGNLPGHVRPLFDLVWSWLPTLRHNARCFVGIDDGIMLPHAVDDRGVCLGNFWTGSIDHGCTAWIAQLMYRHYRFTVDRAFLEEIAYPFMHGAMRVYEEMLDREGDTFTLPVSVSPEYGGMGIDAWGVNASFQLAAIHRLLADLQEASAVLGREPRPIWREIQAGLPKASLTGDGDDRQIAIWDGLPLERSHRHHSHLAGLMPFDVFDWDGNPDERQYLFRSIAHWVWQGAGEWSGWCVPWAAIIHARLGNADAAELWLEIWERAFTNVGHGTLHDVDWAGFSIMGRKAVDAEIDRPEIMQMDAGMSAAAAVHEQLVHVRQGVTWLFRGAPARWKTVGFRRLRTDGAFLLSARRVNGRVGPVTVESLAGGTLRLADPWHEGRVLELTFQAGETRRVTSGAVSQ